MAEMNSESTEMLLGRWVGNTLQVTTRVTLPDCCLFHLVMSCEHFFHMTDSIEIFLQSQKKEIMEWLCYTSLGKGVVFCFYLCFLWQIRVFLHLNWRFNKIRHPHSRISHVRLISLSFLFFSFNSNWSSVTTWMGGLGWEVGGRFKREGT